MFNITLGKLLVAGIIFSILGFEIVPNINNKDSSFSKIYIESSGNQFNIGDIVTINIKVSSSEPTNVFKGTLIFDPTILLIDSINYNTSIADLWAEEPWYSNGDGTLSFTGGTTKKGGFMGDDKLINVNFKVLTPGKTKLSINDVHILRYDGFGSYAPTSLSTDTIINIVSNESKLVTNKKAVDGPTIKVLAPIDELDLNNDGKKTIADMSIFMIHLATQNLRSDFNHDGKVNVTDFSIINTN